MVMDGSATFSFTVDRDAKLDLTAGGPKSPKRVPPAPGKGEEPRKVAPKVDAPAGADVEAPK